MGMERTAMEEQGDGTNNAFIGRTPVARSEHTFRQSLKFKGRNPR